MAKGKAELALLAGTKLKRNRSVNLTSSPVENSPKRKPGPADKRAHMGPKEPSVKATFADVTKAPTCQADIGNGVKLGLLPKGTLRHFGP